MPYAGTACLLQRLEREFPTLESEVTGTKVGIGAATGLDSVYITQDAQLVEADRLLPYAMARDTRTGEFKWSGHYLVNPWDDRGLIDLGAFPQSLRISRITSLQSANGM